MLGMAEAPDSVSSFIKSINRQSTGSLKHIMVLCFDNLRPHGSHNFGTLPELDQVFTNLQNSPSS